MIRQFGVIRVERCITTPLYSCTCSKPTPNVVDSRIQASPSRDSISDSPAMQRPSVKKGQHKKPPPSSSPPSHAAATSSLFSFHVLALLSVYAFAAFFFFYFWQGKQTHEKAMYETQNLTLDHLRQCASIRTAPEDTHFAASMSWSEQSNQRAQEVLAYVTPWNRQGFVVAETYAHKLTYLAPVWYQLRKQHQQQEQQQHQRQQLELTGKHEFNGTWLDNVRHKSGRVRIVPRVIWEVPAFVNPEQVAEVVGLLVDEAKERNYDGCVPGRNNFEEGPYFQISSHREINLYFHDFLSLPVFLCTVFPFFLLPSLNPFLPPPPLCSGIHSNSQSTPAGFSRTSPAASRLPSLRLFLPPCLPFLSWPFLHFKCLPVRRPRGRCTYVVLVATFLPPSLPS